MSKAALCRLINASIAVALAGCSASTKYDIDMTCWEDVYVDGEVFLSLFDYRTDTTVKYTCNQPQQFQIQCDIETLQTIDDVIYCKTHDGQSVRISRVAVPK